MQVRHCTLCCHKNAMTTEVQYLVMYGVVKSALQAVFRRHRSSLFPSLHTHTHTPTGLSHLCEFIEDCEHVELASRILNLLGREGPRTPKPYRYIRFIYNRVLLEIPEVRAGKLLNTPIIMEKTV